MKTTTLATELHNKSSTVAERPATLPVVELENIAKSFKVT